MLKKVYGGSVCRELEYSFVVVVCAEGSFCLSYFYSM